MSAEQLGASLLADVQEGNLDQILAELRQIIEPSGQPLLGQPELDHLIETLQRPIVEQHQAIPGQTPYEHDEDDEDFQDHERVRPDTTPFPPLIPKSTPTVIELTSNASTTGKTSLLYLLSAIAILPHNTNGKESTVIWLDTDGRFSAYRLYQICLTHLSVSVPTLDTPERQTIAKEALKHIHLFPIQSSSQLLQTLETIPSYLLQMRDPHLPQHHSTSRALSLLILDSAQSFTWPDRFTDEIARLEAYGTTFSTASAINPTSPSSSSHLRTAQIIQHLKQIQTKFSSTIIYTTTPNLVQLPTNSAFTSTTTNTTIQSQQTPSTTNPLTPSRPNITPDHASSTLPFISQWTQAATLSLTFSRIKVPQFASHMTIEECLRDRENREVEVRKGRVRVWVTESWLDRVVRDKEARERILKLRNRGAFTLGVDGEGIRIER